MRALNDGVPPLSRTEQFLADLWALWAKKDHPTRVEMQAKAQNAQKQARVVELKALYEKRRATYRLEDSA